MKYLFLFLLIPQISLCQKIETDKIDEFNGSRSIATKMEDIGKKKVLKIYANTICHKEENKTDTGTVLVFMFYTEITQSVGDKSKVIFLFNGGETHEMPNRGEYDLGTRGDFLSVMLLLNDNDKEILRTRQIQKIRISSEDYRNDFEVLEKKQGMISAFIKLLDERVKQ